MAQGTNPSFQCLITRKAEVLVASFSGDINAAYVERFDAYQTEILTKSESRFFILHFTGVNLIAPEIVRRLTQLQMQVRRLAEDGGLRISGLEDNLKQELLKLGVIRASEISRTLNDAVLSVQRLLVLERKHGANKNAA